jgi:hypothetical protein
MVAHGVSCVVFLAVLTPSVWSFGAICLAARDRGQHERTPDSVGRWFKSLRSPGSGVSAAACQLPRDDPSRHREGSAGKRSPASQSDGRRKTCPRTASTPVHEAPSLRPNHGGAPPDALWFGTPASQPITAYVAGAIRTSSPLRDGASRRQQPRCSFGLCAYYSAIGLRGVYPALLCGHETSPPAVRPCRDRFGAVVIAHGV